MSKPGANEPTMEELKRLRDTAVAADSEMSSRFEAYEFNQDSHEDCRIGGYSPEIAEFLAYAANHAVEIIDRLNSEWLAVLEQERESAVNQRFEMQQEIERLTAELAEARTDVQILRQSEVIVTAECANWAEIAGQMQQERDALRVERDRLKLEEEHDYHYKRKLEAEIRELKDLNIQGNRLGSWADQRAEITRLTESNRRLREALEGLRSSALPDRTQELLDQIERLKLDASSWERLFAFINAEKQ